MPPRSDRPPESEFDASAPGYQGRDHLGSLDDFRKGRVNTWWRYLWYPAINIHNIYFIIWRRLVFFTKGIGDFLYARSFDLHLMISPLTDDVEKWQTKCKFLLLVWIWLSWFHFVMHSICYSSIWWCYISFKNKHVYFVRSYFPRPPVFPVFRTAAVDMEKYQRMLKPLKYEKLCLFCWCDQILPYLGSTFDLNHFILSSWSLVVLPFCCWSSIQKHTSRGTKATWGTMHFLWIAWQRIANVILSASGQWSQLKRLKSNSFLKPQGGDYEHQ